MFLKIKNKINKIFGKDNVEKKLRLSSFPFISGDTFIPYSDAIILQNYSKPLKANFFNKNDLIFIENDMLKEKWVLETALNYKKVILHNGDNVPSQDLLNILIENSIKIFATNVKYKENKVFPIPIGLENAHLNNNGDLNYYNFLNFCERKFSKDNLILVSFAVHTDIRKAYENILLKYNLKNNVGMDLNIYRKLLNDSYFVISPPGNGIDCHRTWEAFYHKTIPVIERKFYLFEHLNLPVFVVDSIEDFLILSSREKKEIYKNIFKSQYENIFMQWWLDLIKYS